MKIKRKKEQEEPQFSIDNRGFNVKAWYLKDTKESQGDALIEIRYGGEVVREFLFPSYKIYNIAAHFGDIVDGELSKDDKERGYRIAASTGLEGIVINEVDLRKKQDKSTTPPPRLKGGSVIRKPRRDRKFLVD